MTIEKDIEVKAADGVAECALFRPEGAGPWPGVILYPDIAGLRPVFREMGARLAGEGYVVLVPNPFYRMWRVPVFEEPVVFGDEKTTKRMGEVRPAISPEGTARDAAAFAAFLAADPHVAGGVGVVGYCMGGGLALWAAAAAPELIRAAASFHGGRLATDDPASPHLFLPRMKARLYFGHAVEDRSMPPEMVVRLEKALDDAGLRYKSETYDGARHGWCVKDHSVYAEAQAERAWSNMVALFKESLG